MEIILNNIYDTQKLASVIASVVEKGDVICLNGDLGAGKTTFTKFFAKSLGITEIVNSPTFNIIKCYFNKDINLYHIDAYRLEDNSFDIGLDEYIYGDGVCVIEWGVFIKDLISSKCKFNVLTHFNNFMGNVSLIDELSLDFKSMINYPVFLINDVEKNRKLVERLHSINANVKNVLENVLNVVTDKKLLEQINNLLNNL